jgi:hypothetical protein
MIPKYLYLYVFGSSSFTIHYQNPNPNVIRSSLHVHVMFFLPAVAFLVHAFFPKLVFLSSLSCLQHPSLVDPTLPLESETQVVDLFPSVDPILPLENETQVFNLIPSSVDPTLPLESKPDIAHVFLFDTKSTVLGGIPPYPVEPPPINFSILFYWGVLTGPRLSSHIPFNIIVQVSGWDVPQMLVDEGLYVSILFSIAWKYLGCP